MLNYIIKNTDLYIASKNKSDRKKIGQFFTSKEIAIYMASLLNIKEFKKSVVRIKDPGAGSGILVAALVEELEKNSYIEEIIIVCYENNIDILPLLEKNLNYIKSASSININYIICDENYIINYSNKSCLNLEAQEIEKFDFIIANPPYKKVSSTADEAKCVKNSSFSSPNLYALFASISIQTLKSNAEMVYIIPRSWTSGYYFKNFRKHLFDNAIIEKIHLFESRSKVFKEESILQETIIIKVIKTTSKISNITITTSNSSEQFDNITKILVPYDTVIYGDELYVYLVSNNYELQIVNKIREYHTTLIDIGAQMKTGITVDFRNKSELRKRKGKNTIPLFGSKHINGGILKFPKSLEYEYINSSKACLLQENKNYLFIKRITTKEEKRRIQCSIYLSSSLPEYKYISTNNKINFITTPFNIEMGDELLYGIYVVLNSTIYDTYYRMLNGNTQVNSSEINNVPIPEKDKLIELGSRIKKEKIFTVEYCDKLMEEI